MILLSHIVIALTSLAFSGLTFFVPSRAKLRVSYGLIALTLISGTYLVISLNSPLLSSCMSGLIYLSIVVTATIMARRRLLSINN